MYKEELFSFEKHAIDFELKKKNEGFKTFIEKSIFNNGSVYYIVGYYT